MSAFIARQPNGKYCRFSYVLDCPTDWNMTEQDYIDIYKKRAEEKAKSFLQNNLTPFEVVREDFIPNNMTQDEFERFLEEVGAETGGGENHDNQ